LTRTETILLACLIVLVIIFGGVYASLTSSINALSKSISELSSKVDELSGKVNTLTGEVRKLPEAIRGVVPPPTPPTPPTPPAPPAKLGEFHFACGWPKPPAYHGNPFGPGGVGGAYWFIYEPLAYYIPANMTFIKALAESWETKDTSLVVHLRKDAYWHDGKPVTSKDVKTTWALVGAVWARRTWQFIKSIETPDDYTVIFHLTIKPSPLLQVMLLTQPILAPDHIFGKFTDRALEVIELAKKVWALQAAGKEVPEDLMTEYKDKRTALTKDVREIKPGLPVGNGAFKVVKVTETEMLLEKFDKHYLANKIMFGKIRAYYWTANEVVWSYLMAGKIDCAHPATPPDVVKQILATEPRMHHILVTDLSQFAIAFNLRIKPFSDINFRKAIAYAVNRVKMREVGYFWALDTPYAHGVLPSMQSIWLPEDVLAKFTKYEYDPKKAEEILRAAGYKKGPDGYWRTPEGEVIELEVTCPAGYSDWVLALDELVRQLNEFGIKAEARPIPNPTFWPTAHSGKLGMHLNWFCGWAGTGDPYTGYYDLFFGDRSKDTGVGTGANGLGLVNKEFDTPWGKAIPAELMEQLLVETDPEKRKEIVWKLAYIVNENLWEIPWAEKRLQIFYLDGVRATGWPAPTDPVWTLYPGGAERLMYVLITHGVIKPVVTG